VGSIPPRLSQDTVVLGDVLHVFGGTDGTNERDDLLPVALVQ